MPGATRMLRGGDAGGIGARAVGPRGQQQCDHRLCHRAGRRASRRFCPLASAAFTGAPSFSAWRAASSAPERAAVLRRWLAAAAPPDGPFSSAVALRPTADGGVRGRASRACFAGRSACAVAGAAIGAAGAEGAGVGSGARATSGSGAAFRAPAVSPGPAARRRGLSSATGPPWAGSEAAFSCRAVPAGGGLRVQGGGRGPAGRAALVSEQGPLLASGDFVRRPARARAHPLAGLAAGRPCREPAAARVRRRRWALSPWPAPKFRRIGLALQARGLGIGSGRRRGGGPTQRQIALFGRTAIELQEQQGRQTEHRHAGDSADAPGGVVGGAAGRFGRRYRGF